MPPPAQTKYALKFAGQDVVRPTPELTDVLDKYLERHAPPLWSHPGWDTRGIDHLPIPAKPKPIPTRLNVLTWPTGVSRWGHIDLLVGSTAYAAMVAATNVTAPTPQDLTITKDGAAYLTVKMFLLSGRPLFLGANAADPTKTVTRGLYHVTLVDYRYFAWDQSLTYGFASGQTWKQLLDGLVAAGFPGATPTYDTTVPVSYGDPWPLRWSAPGCPLPLLIDAAAAQVGYRAIVKPSDGTIKFIRATAALASDKTRWDTWKTAVVVGGRLLPAYTSPPGVKTQYASGNTPASVNVGFPGDSQSITNVTLASLSLAEYGTVTGITNSAAWVRADERAGEVSPSPSALADQMATDYYLWALSPTDATFRGIVGDNVISGCEDRVEIEYLRPYQDHRPSYRPMTDPAANAPAGKNITEDRILTRVVPVDQADRNLYGDRPYPGYTYPVKITAVTGNTMKATIRKADTAGTSVDDGPKLGYGGDNFVLLRDPLNALAVVGDTGTAIPDPIVPYRWVFEPSGSGSSGGGSTCLSGYPGWDYLTCVQFTVNQGLGSCDNVSPTVITGTRAPLSAVWIGLDTFPVATGDATIEMTTGADGLPVMTLVVTGGSGSGGGTYTGVRVGCSGSDILFSFSNPALCDGTRSDTCDDNVFTIGVHCIPCPAVLRPCFPTPLPTTLYAVFVLTRAADVGSTCPSWVTDFNGFTIRLDYDSGTGAWAGVGTFSGGGDDYVISYGFNCLESGGSCGGFVATADSVTGGSCMATIPFLGFCQSWSNPPFPAGPDGGATVPFFGLTPVDPCGTCYNPPTGGYGPGFNVVIEA